VTALAVGVDGARGGWVAAFATAGSGTTRMELFADIAALTAAVGDAAVAIDVPIGLYDSVAFRRCDLAARRLLRARASTVFAPPARYMLRAAGDYAAIRRLVAEEREHNPQAKSLSAQAAGIAAKVREVDDWVRAHPDSERWLFECHPELSFLALNDGAPLREPKHTTAGRARRLQLVREAFPDAERRISAAPWSASQAATADLLDAYAALSTALACARGKQQELGDGERDSAGVLMRIVFASVQDCRPPRV
jgi:predicted RNase H-like nuclease